MFSEKFPSKSVVVPIVVPEIMILAPIRGSFVFKSFTFPSTLVCPMALAQIKIKLMVNVQMNQRGWWKLRLNIKLVEVEFTVIILVIDNS